MGDYSTALEYSFQASHLMLADHASPLRQASIYANRGDILWRVEEAEQAIECSQQALALFQEHSDRLNKSVVLINLGTVYYSRHNYREALNHCYQGLAIAQETGNFEVQTEARMRIGSVYLQMGELSKALSYLSQALQVSEQIGSRFYQSETLLYLGSLYAQLNSVRESVETFEKALQIGEQLNSKEVCYKAHLALSKTYEKQNKTAAALTHYQSFHGIWQEIYSATASRKVQRLLLERGFAGRRLHSNPPPFQTFERIAARDGHARLSPRKLREVIEFIRHHLEHSLTLDDVAAVAAMSRRQFQDAFKSSTGKTLHQFLVEERIKRAQELLQTTNLPLSEIALQCGFSSQSHLTTQFRLTTGATPRQFRQSF